MRLDEISVFSVIKLSTLLMVHGAPNDGGVHEPPSTAQFFFGKHTRASLPQWFEYEDDSDDEDDYKPLDTSTSDDEGQTNSTMRHSSEQKTGYDSDEDDRDNQRRNNFLIHRARKRTKNEQRFVWYPFTPSFLINYEPYAPANPYVISKWSRKPNDILLVVLQQRQPPPSPPASPTASCTCGSQNETSTSTGDLRRERNESSSSASVDEPHLTATADGPSSCIWAIVACCAPNNFHFRYGCFAYLSCSVAFWEIEPCQLPIMLEAARQVHVYYDQITYGHVGQPHPDAENYPNDDVDAQDGKNATTPAKPTPTPSTTKATPISTTGTTTTTSTSTTTTTTAAPTTSPTVT